MDDGKELLALAALRVRELVEAGRLTPRYTMILSGSNGAILALRVGERDYTVMATNGIPGPMTRPVGIFLHDDAGAVETLVVADAPPTRAGGIVH